MPMATTTGAVLVGGKGTRMGTDKAIVPFRDAPMVSHVAGSLVKAGLEVLVVGRQLDGYESIPDDDHDGGGPLIGLLTALRHTGGDVFLVAVDQPLLQHTTVRRLMEQPGEAVVPDDAGHPQVTCALFRAACLPVAETVAGAGERKLRRLLDHVATTLVAETMWSRWGEDGRSWLSLDTPDALRRAEDLR